MGRVPLALMASPLTPSTEHRLDDVLTIASGDVERAVHGVGALGDPGEAVAAGRGGWLGRGGRGAGFRTTMRRRPPGRPSSDTSTGAPGACRRAFVRHSWMAR
ncbi:hypothetical protein BC477_00545 [Clavibacter michiganensis subsp. michiganensis]|uniref:Uncharacterized protein n=1 Tax=Clavibacter michiganensis subsp. michiganensis TaxID=33013 RepID=A0A251XF62_CLAMM|nr:hypothetical protein BC477_00545 [Clavibacter michiganensis subsp. michiganensis]OUE00936.1 hypothetical protein CMMCAS07_15970 [Clavibacter michiganensis subsp. michiganensis]